MVGPTAKLAQVCNLIHFVFLFNNMKHPGLTLQPNQGYALPDLIKVLT